MSEGITRLSAFPRHELYEDALLSLRTRELALLEILGPPTQTMEELADDPCFFWDLVWECGLVMAIEFHQLSEHTVVHLGADDVPHALRHLDVPIDDLELLADTDPDRFTEMVGEISDSTYELWRVDGGRPVCIEIDLTEADVRCRERSLNHDLDQQRYFAQVSSGAPAPQPDPIPSI